MLRRNCIKAIGSTISNSTTLPMALTLFMSQWRRLQLPLTWQFPQALGIKQEAPNENTWRLGNWWATKLRLWVMANAMAYTNKQRRSSESGLRSTSPGQRKAIHWPRLHFNWLFVSFAFLRNHDFLRSFFSLRIFQDKIINQRWIR